MKRFIYIFFFLLSFTPLFAQHAYLNLSVNDKGKVKADGVVFDEYHMPKQYKYEKPTKKVNGFKVVEFDEKDFIFERTASQDYKGIQGFPAIYNTSGFTLAGTITLPDAVVICGQTLGTTTGYFAVTRIQKVVFSPSIKYIGEDAFAHCRSLMEIVFPEGCEDVTIEKDAFKGCINLQKVKVPRGKTAGFSQKMHLPDSIFEE